jgi:HD-GYP domain-containing protein (c-di-GMP phosphodiesterase class II)
MRFGTRAFLLSFLPFALLLTGSFWAMQKLVQSTVHDELRSSLRENELSVARLRSRSELQNSRFLKVVGENASLKAGLQLLLSDPASAAARATVEDQLRELCAQMGFDLLMVSDPRGGPLVGVLRPVSSGPVFSIDAPNAHVPRNGLMMLSGRIFQVASVPMDQGDENLGEMSIGESFDFSDFSPPAVLLRHGKVLKSSIRGISVAEAEAALGGCRGQAECDVKLGGEMYISLPLQSISFGDGYILRSLQNVDSASGPVRRVLHNIFLTALIGALLAAVVFSLVSARSIVRPIEALIANLRNSERTGMLAEIDGDLSAIREIRELECSFNRAACVIAEGRAKLQRAYLEFVGSLASALDARDRYTAGHSRRVSELACATARALALNTRDLDEIRIGALLHDIGKIGIADSILQKPGVLTGEEFSIVKTHPEIGRRILERVNGFAPYLDAVEFHHENWDGTGYPGGRRGEETPLAARIIHISDAYDAMTTSRPYRRGMSHEEALGIIRKFRGSHFDPNIVDVFAGVHKENAPGSHFDPDTEDAFAEAREGSAR